MFTKIFLLITKLLLRLFGVVNNFLNLQKHHLKILKGNEKRNRKPKVASGLK